MSASSLLRSLFEYKAWANEELFNGLSAIDETAHPTERQNAIRLLNHVYVVDRIFAANLERKSHGYSATNTEETPTLEALHDAVQATDRWYVEYVRALAAEALSEQLELAFTDGLRGRMSREEMLAHVVTHGNYHRGAVGRMMSQLSIAPPRDIYTVFLHTSEPERRART